MIRRLIILLLIVGCGTEPEDCAGVNGGDAKEDDCGSCSSVEQFNSSCTISNLPLLSSNYHAFNIAEINLLDRYYYNEQDYIDIVNLETAYWINNVDENGYPLKEYNDNNYYHPVYISQIILKLISSYLKTNDIKYLELAEYYSEALLINAHEFENMIFFPYEFTFTLHGAGVGEDIMNPPWYSGMAQGQGLSVYSRLYEITENNYYKDISKKIFNTFKLPPTEDSPWVVWVDNKNYYWIAEYPVLELTTRTLNGFIFSIFGLYDYFMINLNNNETEFILQASITTIKEYIELYRIEDEVSLYCLKPHAPLYRRQSAFYHKIHTEQLLYLYKISLDEYFYTMHVNFYNDYH